MCNPALAQVDDILKKAGDALSHRNTAGLPDQSIIAGLKQALQVGTGKAVAFTGRPDGFSRTRPSKSFCLQSWRRWGGGLRMPGTGAKLDNWKPA